jgi:hypothetical protein
MALAQDHGRRVEARYDEHLRAVRRIETVMPRKHERLDLHRTKRECVLQVSHAFGHRQMETAINQVNRPGEWRTK